MQPGTFSAQQIAQLTAVLEQARQAPGPLMPVLQKAQEIFGYLPEDVQTAIAAGLGVPVSEVYGVATFYSQFTMQPRGAHVVSVCMGTACYV
ncbi:MAG: NAD(P)H-dependent oxidoreductase subunit E, partial [Clostridia bacterium]|nr:NAD(P)H-dependent oxidoreductase subunit E [Clostridia bacterium]